MKRIRRYVICVTGARAERDKKRGVKGKLNENTDNMPKSAIEPKAARNARKHRRRTLNRCASRHSMVLGYFGFPAARPQCSAWQEEEAETEGRKLAMDTELEVQESGAFTVTLPYPFSISTIVGAQHVFEGGKEQKGGVAPDPASKLAIDPVSGAASSLASDFANLNLAPDLASSLATNFANMYLPSNFVSDPVPPLELTATSSSSGHPWAKEHPANSVSHMQGSEELTVNAVIATSADSRRNDTEQASLYDHKYSKYERLLGRYWMEQDYEGNTRMERWVDGQIYETVKYHERKERQRAKKHVKQPGKKKSAA